MPQESPRVVPNDIQQCTGLTSITVVLSREKQGITRQVARLGLATP